jgi:hypothetical protein
MMQKSMSVQQVKQKAPMNHKAYWIHSDVNSQHNQSQSTQAVTE